MSVATRWAVARAQGRASRVGVHTWVWREGVGAKKLWVNHSMSIEMTSLKRRISFKDIQYVQSLQ